MVDTSSNRSKIRDKRGATRLFFDGCYAGQNHANGPKSIDFLLFRMDIDLDVCLRWLIVL
jgi:hypothetical protein